MTLRIARDVAWLRLGSCTDHVISAAAAIPAKDSNPRPASSRKRRAKASRIVAGKWPTRGITRSIAGMLMRTCDWSQEQVEARVTRKLRFLPRGEKRKP